MSGPPRAGEPVRPAAWKRLAARVIPDGASLPILAGPLKGSRWLAGAAPGPGKGLSVLFNRSEPGQLRAAERLAVPGAVCFDVGAHAGMYTLLFARRCRRVLAFEPLPRNLAWLGRTLAANRVGNVEIIPWALGGTTGPARFREGAHSSEGGLDPQGDVPVFSITCDEFAERYGVYPTLMKIDVEGAELELLRGAEGVLRKGRPALLLSTHGDGVKAACLAFLHELGYGEAQPLDADSAAGAREFAITA